MSSYTRVFKGSVGGIFLLGLILQLSTLATLAKIVSLTNAVPKIHAGTWTEVAPMPTNSYLLSAVSYHNSLYAIGGEDSDLEAGMSAVSIFSGSSWVSGPPLPKPNASGGAVVYNGLIYFVGGGTPFIDPTNDIFTFDGLSWNTAGVLPDGIKMQGMGIANYNGSIYTLGGFFTSVASGYHGSATVMTYNGNEWKQSAFPYPNRVLYPGLASFQGKLYGLGGISEGGVGVGFSFGTNVFCFDGSGWTEVAGMPKSLYAMGVSVLGKYLYVAGGMDLYNKYSTNVYRFDGISWMEVDSLPVAVVAPGMETFNNSLVLVGGAQFPKERATNRVYRFVPLSLAPQIIKQPEAYNTASGASVSLGVEAVGDPTLKYQWRFNGKPISNGTNAVLEFENAQTDQTGDYDVVVTNPYGSVVSSAAHVIVATYAVWGDNRDQETDIFNPAKSPLSVALGWYHTVALMSDHTVVAWGDNKFGQANVPSGLSNVIAISAGAYHTLALKDDGTVVGWGLNWFGQGGSPITLSNVVAISSGGFHNLALKQDGSVFSWGYNYYQECDVPAGLAGVTAISAGSFHSLALLANGTVRAWGFNLLGQSATPIGLSGVKSIAAGAYHNMAVKADGSVVGWGDNRYLQLQPPVGLNHVISVACGDSHTLALRDDGSVVSWGHNQWEQSEVPPGLQHAVFIAAGGDHSVVLVDQPKQ